jgi:lipoprotein-releasing system permease protein
MNFPFYIARKVAFSSKKSFSRLIIKIATVAVAVSIAVMLITTAVIRGFKNQITDKIFGLWGQIHITDASINNQTLDLPPISLADSKTFYPSLQEIREVDYTVPNRNIFTKKSMPILHKKTLGGIHHMQVFATSSGIIKTKEEIEGIVVKGIGNDFDWDFMRKSLVDGAAIGMSDTSASRDIIISQVTANRLNIKVKDKIVIYFFTKSEQKPLRFSVCGIYKTGLEEYDKKIAFVDIKVVQNLLSWDKNQVAGFEIFVENYDDIEKINDYIYAEKLPNNLYSETIKEKFKSIFQWLDLQNTNGVVIVLLMGIVAIINMMTALLILILDRTEMIGILKSMGADNWIIRKIFLFHAGIIVARGLFWGNLIGLLICWLQKNYKIVKLTEADYYLSYAPIEFHWPTIFFLNLGTLMVVVAFLIIPTYYVTKISPVKAIKLS